MARAEISDLQSRKLRSQIRRAWQSPFYQQRFEAVGLSRDDPFQPEQLTALPLTRKEDLCDDVAEHPPYGSRLTVEPHQVVRVVETSGTSGKGKEVHVSTRADLERIVEMESAGFVWAGVEPGTVVAFTIPITLTAASSYWDLALQALDANVLRMGHLSTNEKLRYMTRYGAEVLIATPTYLGRLEHAASEIGIDPIRDLNTVRTISVAGEARSAHWVAERQRVWGATVYEQWGCTQGVVAWSCEEGMATGGRPGILQGLPHLAIMEVVDPQEGGPVADGDYGELVITPLGVTGTPLIRFATGDRVRFRRAEHCECGRAFDGIEAGSVSRYDDMLKVKGVNVAPPVVDALIDQRPEVLESRVTVDVDDAGRETLTIEVEFRPETSSAARSQVVESLTHDVRRATEIGVGVAEWKGSEALADVVLGGTSWKARRWRDLRRAP